MQPLIALFHDHAWPTDILIGILIALVFSTVVFVHEFGHYWVARRCGIRVLSFSIGFGRPLFSWTDRHGTQWQVACLPLGGYVKMFGDANPASAPDPAVKQMTEAEKQTSFYHQNVNKCIAVVAAGPAANYIFAIVVMAFLFMTVGQEISAPVAHTVAENGAAARAGILPGDKIVSIGGKEITQFDDIVRTVTLSMGEPLPFVIERDGARQTLAVTPDVIEQTNNFGGHSHIGRIGIGSGNLEYKKRSPLAAFEQAGLEAWNLTTTSLKGLGQIVMGTRSSQELGGPILIVKLLNQAAQNGAARLIWAMAFISINLGLVNLFPVPLLDGGHLLFYFYEKLRGRPLNEKVQEFGMRIGLALIVSLMLLTTSNDLHLVAWLKARFS